MHVVPPEIRKKVHFLKCYCHFLKCLHDIKSLISDQILAVNLNVHISIIKLACCEECQEFTIKTKSHLEHVFPRAISLTVNQKNLDFPQNILKQ